MTLEELFQYTANHPTSILIFFLMIPISSFIIGAFTDEDERYESPWQYIYSTLIYLACIPGILALTLCFYHLLFDRRSFLDLNVLTYFVPIVAMIGTIFVIKQDVDLDEIPGFNRIPGLAIMIAVTFLIILLIQKTRIWLVFSGGSGFNLLLIFIGLFLLFRWGWGRFIETQPSRSTSTNRKIW